jgi:Zn finger protein HypA/HybF involved in hydrogenase expression
MNLPKVEYKELGQCHPSLARGQVWCLTCGRTQKVDSAKCLQTGWPKCCGETMTIDSPEERKRLEGKGK